MESQHRKYTEITLVLTEQEADWLKSMVKNGIDGAEESPQSREIRGRFWKALNPTEVR